MSRKRGPYRYWKIGLALVVVFSAMAYTVEYLSRDTVSCGYDCGLVVLARDVSPGNPFLEFAIEGRCSEVVGVAPTSGEVIAFRESRYQPCYVGSPDEVRARFLEASEAYRQSNAVQTATFVGAVWTALVILFWPILKLIQAFVFWSDVKRTELVARKMEAERRIEASKGSAKFHSE